MMMVDVVEEEEEILVVGLVLALVVGVRNTRSFGVENSFVMGCPCSLQLFSRRFMMCAYSIIQRYDDDDDDNDETTFQTSQLSTQCHFKYVTTTTAKKRVNKSL